MLERATAAGVAGMAVCGTSPSDWAQVFQCSEAGSTGGLAVFQGLEVSPQIYLGIGLHPWFVPADGGINSKEWKDSFQTLEACLAEDKTEAAMLWLGETGLDFSERFTNRIEQEECFAAHLDLARELDRTVTVHCVQAWGRMVEILREHPAPNVMLHAYSGSEELIPELIKLNGWFSFGEAVMNPKAKRARAAVIAVPADRLLIETDSDGEPEKLIDVARAVAELRGVPVEEIAELTFNNAQTLFVSAVESFNHGIH